MFCFNFCSFCCSAVHCRRCRSCALQAALPPASRAAAAATKAAPQPCVGFVPLAGSSWCLCQSHRLSYRRRLQLLPAKKWKRIARISRAGAARQTATPSHALCQDPPQHPTKPHQVTTNPILSIFPIFPAPSCSFAPLFSTKKC